jgi:hypothetical protein
MVISGGTVSGSGVATDLAFARDLGEAAFGVGDSEEEEDGVRRLAIAMGLLGSSEPETAWASAPRQASQ